MGLHLLEERALVLLERQYIIGPTLDQRRGNGALTADGVDAHYAAGDLHQVEHLRDGDELVGFAGHLGLGQAQALCGSPDADQLYASLALARQTGAAHLFAIDGQLLPSQYP